MALETWIMLPGWGFLDHYTEEGFLDHLQEAGVDNMVFGGTPPVDPDREMYRECGIEPSAPAPEVMARVDGVTATLEKARERGMGVYLYGTNPGMSLSRDGRFMTHKVILDVDLSLREAEGDWAVCVNCPRYLSYYRARLRDIYRHLPCDGFVNDGPEFGYEISPGFMGGGADMFACFCPICAQKAEEMGYDLGGFQAAAGRLRGWLRHLDPAVLEEFVQPEGGLFDVLDFFFAEPELQDWLRFKTASVDAYVQALCREVKSLGRNLEIGIGSRTAAFAPLTGHNLGHIIRHADFVLPKLYFWMGGYDGLYGTAYRWVKALKSWNAPVPESLLFRFVYRLFGFKLPQVESLQDIARYIDPACIDNLDLTREGASFPDAFFAEVVATEAGKMVRRAGDASRVRPWVCPSHGGRILTPRELDLLLGGAEQGGLTTYLYYCALEGEEWEVARKHARLKGLGRDHELASGCR